MTDSDTSLNRSLSLSAMVFYGLGTIVGAGIYVLIGEIAGRAGVWTPLSFVLAALIAGFTGLAYAELVGRYPKSAGEAVYVQQAFGQKWLSQMVGWGVVITGIVSASTLIKGFSGYFLDLFGGQEVAIIVFSVIAITLLACSGVKQSVGVAVTITILELAGLLLVVLASAEPLTEKSSWYDWANGLTAAPPVLGIVNATFLAFYAFIGFEDMVNMAEEVKDASRNLPKAIIIAIALSTGIYFLVSLVIVVAVDPQQLSESSAPLTMVASQSTWFPAPLLSVISLVAILNGAIVQLLMAPRVIYGISKETTHLKCLSLISRQSKTPVVATMVVAVLVLIFTLWLPLAQLAQLTSGIILSVFILVNGALLTIKLKSDTTLSGALVEYQGFQVSKWVPIAGLLSSLLLLLAQFTLL